MDPIQNIVHQVIGDISQKGPHAQHKIQEVWERSIDEKERAHVRIRGFFEGRLRIDVDSPSTFFHMNLKKKALLEKIKQEVPEIKDICFSIRKLM